MSKIENCPCGSGKTFSQCCNPYITGEQAAETPEQLMRSRYSAFVAKQMDYVFETTDPQIRSKLDHQANVEWSETATFQKLEVISSSNEGNKGTVEFKAYYKTKDQDEVHHELSRFRKQSGTWYFRDGRVISTPKQESK